MMKAENTTTSGFEEIPRKSGADGDEMMAIDEECKPSEERRDDSARQEQEESEGRDDSGIDARCDDTGANERVDAPAQKASTKPTTSRGKHRKQGSGSSQQGRRYQPEGFQGHYGHGRGPPFQPPGQGGPRGHANAPAPFPHPPYGYDPYRGPPPPPHFLPHPGQPPYAGPPPGVPFHPGQAPPHLNMPGHPGAPGFHMPPYHPGAPYPPGAHPVHYPGMQPHFPPKSISASDSGSITSTKSKGSVDGRKSKSSGSSTSGSRKKRTIDGVHERQGPPPGGMSAFSFPRTNSNSSTSSTVTAGNNTSTETPCLTDDSPQKQTTTRDRGSELPPLSHPSSSNLFEDADHLNGAMKHHRRGSSAASTASSLSMGGLSMASYERASGSANDDVPMMKASPKRRKGHDSRPSSIDTGASMNSRGRSNSTHSLDVTGAPARFQSLSMEDSSSAHQRASSNGNLFLSLSTSPINADVEATPNIKNTKKSSERANNGKDTSRGVNSFDQDTPTPPLPENAMAGMTDEHLLNQHLRSQSFTPLSHLANGSEGRESVSNSPTMTNPSFSGIAPQLSWSIAGDAPSLADLAEWDEVKPNHYRNPSQASSGPRGMVLSPQDFSMWTEEVDAIARSQQKSGGEGDSIRLSALSPNSMTDEGISGTTTPLPIFFDRPTSGEERENIMKKNSISEKDKNNQGPRMQFSESSGMRAVHPEFGDPEHIHQLFVTNGGRGSAENNRPFRAFPGRKNGDPLGLPHIRLPPTPVYGGQFDDSFGRSPLNRDGREGPPPDFFPSGNMFGHPNNGMVDRVRNLRGRVPPNGHHAPMQLQVPPPVTSLHHSLTSPMGVGSNGKVGMWGMHPGHSPHHMQPPDRNASKRKCVPLKPPIPSKFQGNIEKVKSAQVPEFTSLVNFPAHMSQKQSVNLPDRMRCCVMCGQACPCSTGGKNKKSNNNNSGAATSKSASGKSSGEGLANRSNNGQDADKQGEGFAIIPTQNKGLCTLCDVNVWVVTQSGLEIKWCKGCKNFRPWAAFGDKGLATKCLRCRERQREKYALQKEEKEKARIINKTIKNKA